MEERKGFGSNFGFLMAAVGSAVGLGNIWGFPYKMGANGGFTFLLVYIFLGVTCGFIVMISELAMGRKTGKGAVEAYRIVSKKFKWMGWLGILSAFFILFFYCAPSFITKQWSYAPFRLSLNAFGDLKSKSVDSTLFISVGIRVLSTSRYSSASIVTTVSLISPDPERLKKAWFVGFKGHFLSPFIE